MALEDLTGSNKYTSDLVPEWPVGRDFRSQGAPHVRGIKNVLQNTWPNVDGPVSATDEELSFGAGVTSAIQDQLDALGARIDDVEASVAGLQGQLNAPSGTRMVFHQAAAPAGWVNAADANDAVLRSVNSGAGGLSGSWTISGIASGSHILTINEMPYHNHGGGVHGHNLKTANDASAGGNDDSITGAATANPNYIWPSGAIILYEGGNAGHTHPFTSDGAWRPRAADVLICAKT